MIKIVADDRIPYLKGVLEQYGKVKYLPGIQIENKVLRDADALIIRTRTKCTEQLLKETGIRFIASATIGFDHIDTHYCATHGIKWANAPGCNSSSVQQYIAAALVKISFGSGLSLKDKTLGIIGVGNVGSKIDKLAKALGMRVLLNDPPRQRAEDQAIFADLETTLREADIITLHVPLNRAGEDKTYHLIDERSVKLLKKGAWLINTSRGEVTETQALKKALDSGAIGGAVLDVWENEPDIDMEMMRKAFLATPHIAGYSADGKANGTAMAVHALADYFNLPLTNWYPEQIPAPRDPVITPDGKGRTEESVIGEAILHTYDISGDDTRLRLSPGDFEKQRGDYPVRREFPAYKIRLKNTASGVRKTLGELGFKV